MLKILTRVWNSPSLRFVISHSLLYDIISLLFQLFLGALLDVMSFLGAIVVYAYHTIVLYISVLLL